MDSEKEVLERVKRRLQQIGYGEASIREGVKSLMGEADIVIYAGERPRIAVEVKESVDFLQEQEMDSLRFHPTVRKLQSLAKSLGAPYYLIADSSRWLWFTTDDAGRPEMLSSPVFPVSRQDESSAKVRRGVLISILQELWDVSFKHLGHTTSEGPALALYAKLLGEAGDARLRDFLLRPEYRPEWWDEVLPFEGRSTLERLPRDYYAEALSLLDRVNFSKAPERDLLSAIDDALIGRELRSWRVYRLPRWLTQLAVQLAELEPSDTVLDIYSPVGDVAAAIGLRSPNTEVWSIADNPRSVLWARIQQLVVNARENRTIEGRVPPYEVFDQHRGFRPTRVLAFPPFGARVTTPRWDSDLGRRNTSTSSEDLYLELALRWVRPGGRVVAVVPDGLLFAKSRRAVRDFLLERSQLRAIISLGTGSLESVRASLLVIENAPAQASRGVFMTRLEPAPSSDGDKAHFDSYLNRLLRAFIDWERGRGIPTGLVAWSVPPENLDSNNLSAEFYKPVMRDNGQPGRPLHEDAPLLAVAEQIKRGAAITLSKDGEVPVIGPAAIRPVVLDSAHLDKTSAERIRRTPVFVQANDIVLNAVGTHCGDAALVLEDMAGLLISRHVILIRPNPEVVLPQYLAVALNSEFVKPQLERLAMGAVIPTLTIAALENVAVPLPDLKEQHRIAEMVMSARNGWLLAQRNADEEEKRFNRLLKTLADDGAEQ